MLVLLVTILSFSVLGTRGVDFFGLVDISSIDFTDEDYKHLGEEFFSIWNAPDPVSRRRLHAQRMLKLMNQSVNPCEDFYEYSCGNYSEYLKNTSVKNEYGFAGTLNIWVLQNLLDSMVERNISIEITEFYDRCWNSISYKIYTQYVEKILEQFGGPENFKWLEMELFLDKSKLGVLFKYDDYELKLASEEIQLKYSSFQTYMNYARRILRSFGMSTAKINKMMRDVYHFKKKLGPLISALVEEGLYETEFLTEADLEQMFPGIDFNRYENNHIASRKNLTEFMNQTNSTILYNFYYWEMLKKIRETIIDMRFTSKIERKYACAAAANQLMPVEAARVFMQEFVNAEVREDVLNMVEGIRGEVTEMLRKNRWFDRPTRMEALKKIENIVSVIGLPEEILNETAGESEFSKMTLLEMILTLQQRNSAYRDKVENENRAIKAWGGMSSIDEAAYYTINGVMLILAGILVHPFYHKDYAYFYKYANVGATVGHELMHGFDSDGMKYDADFNRREWVTPRLKAMYVRSAECFYSLYNQKYQALGLQTISENVPDIVGLEIAYKAYKSWAKTTENFSASELEGYEEFGMDVDHLFFLSQAQSYCDVNKDVQEEGDTHAPSKIRANAAVANSRDFSRAFNCPSESEMYIKRNCRYLF